MEHEVVGSQSITQITIIDGDQFQLKLLSLNCLFRGIKMYSHLMLAKPLSIICGVRNQPPL